MNGWGSPVVNTTKEFGWHLAMSLVENCDSLRTLVLGFSMGPVLYPGAAVRKPGFPTQGISAGSLMHDWNEYWMVVA